MTIKYSTAAFSILIMFILYGVCSCHSSLHTKFSYFEVITPRHIAVRVKRDADGRETHKKLTLSILGRKLTLSLTPRLPESFLPSNANIRAVHANGTNSKIDLDLNDFHRGIIEGHPESRVNCFYHEGLWTIHVVHRSLSFSVEPLSLHLGFERNQMVVYRHRHIKTPNETNHPFCEHLTYEDESSPSTSTINDYIMSKGGRRRSDNNVQYTLARGMNRMRSPKNISISRMRTTRKERNIDPKNRRPVSEKLKKSRQRKHLLSYDTCDLLAIADYSFYSVIGEKSFYKTTKILIQTYATVSDIFSSVKFPSGKRINIQIRSLEVYDHPGDILPEIDPKTETDGVRLIRTMKQKLYFQDYCLVHLSAQLLLQKQVLGLALTATAPTLHGICGSLPRSGSLNIGLSTVTHNDYTLSFKTYILVLAHELAHGFGARHDNPEKDPLECYPSESQGGRYIMWYKTSQGTSPNNNKFSSCSIREMSVILKSRPRCLMSGELMDHNTCGNGILDYGEDCDPGLLRFHETGTCCNENCLFLPKAVCSPFNYPCCRNCTVAPKGEPCTNKLSHRCSQESFCDGRDFHHCPNAPAKPDGSSCDNEGICQAGSCIDYCRLLGQKKDPQEYLESCGCDSDKRAMCTICCKPFLGLQSTCNQTDKVYEDGTPCLIGYCLNGACSEAESFDKDYWGVMGAPNPDDGQDLTTSVLAVSDLPFSITMMGVAVIFALGVFALFLMKPPAEEAADAEDD